MKEHLTTAPCSHEECCFLRTHGSDCCICGSTRHAVASDWGAYSFGHSGGHVAFLTACPTCGRVDTGHVLGVEWSAKELSDANLIAGRAP